MVTGVLPSWTLVRASKTTCNIKKDQYVEKLVNVKKKNYWSVSVVIKDSGMSQVS